MTALVRACSAVGVLAMLAVSAQSRADAIDPPPSSCPTGSVGTSSHSGSWCEAYTCTTDADCAGVGRMGAAARSYTCAQVDVCVRTETYTGGGRIALQPGQTPPTHTREVGVGACGSSCTAPASCTHAKRCVETTASSIRNVGGCSSCSAAAVSERASGTGAAAAAALTTACVLLALVLARRSQRSR